MIIRSRNGPEFLFKYLGRQLQYHWFLKQVEHGFLSFFAKCLPDSMIFQSFVLARETNNDISLPKSFKREIDQLLQKESLLFKWRTTNSGSWYYAIIGYFLFDQ